MAFHTPRFTPPDTSAIARVNIAAALQIPLDDLPAELRPTLERQLRSGHVVVKTMGGVERVCAG